MTSFLFGAIEVVLLPAIIFMFSRGIQRFFRPGSNRNVDNTGDALADQSPNPSWTGANGSGRSSTSKTMDEKATATVASPPSETQDTVDAQLHEIYHIVFLLRQKLVSDVISQIMEEAGFFVKQTCSRELQQPFHVAENASPRQCLETPPITCSARVQRPVSKVVFDIQSRDQGWTSTADGGSWTWFTARIERRADTTTAAAAAIPDNSASKDAETETVHQSDQMLESPAVNEIEIVRNPAASRNWVSHHVELTREDSDWVASLTVGDWITVQAWARFPGWFNRVKQVDVTIHTTAVV